VGRCGGVGASGWGVPDQDTRFGLFQPPPLGLLTTVVVTAQWGQVAFAGDSAVFPGQGVVQVAANSGPAAPRRGALVVTGPD
jgi:hypothetical protein